ncbi:hypothetical protein ACWIGI_25180 [Nocardia sp. NPDC055321]
MTMTNDPRERAAGFKVLGWLAIVFAVGLFVASWSAGNDAENPRCDGQQMSRSDACLGSTDKSYDERAESASNAQQNLLYAGGGTLVLGLVLLGASAAVKPE